MSPKSNDVMPQKRSRRRSSRRRKRSPKPTNPRLWREIKEKWHRGAKGGKAGQWNARKAQLAVQEYKRRGGRYRGPKRCDSSLAIWTREDWGYVNDKKGNRYLPAAVRRKLTPRERRIENRRKRSATRRGRQRAAYSPSVARKMRRARVGKRKSG